MNFGLIQQLIFSTNYAEIQSLISARFVRVKTAEIKDRLMQNLGLEPTRDQYRFIHSIASFLVDQPYERVYILRGYAGTGKTTLVKAIAKTLPLVKMSSVLLAPTGRAAKVLSNYSGRHASTIHRRIYAQESKDGRDFTFRLAHNKSKNTLFIVDEASMISGNFQQDGAMYAGSNLLEDFLSYVDDGENCSVLFIGDIAQLPPVNERVSPSLSPKLLMQKLMVRALYSELREVVRQRSDSGILFNATAQRNRLMDKEGAPLIYPNDNDVIALDAYSIEDALQTAYSDGMEETIVITRSNKQAIMYNRQIRHQILYREAELEVGDLLMVVKNNYFWLDAKSKAGFIANGDTLELLSIGAIEEKWGFRFAKCDVRMIDYPNQEPIEVILNLNALYAEAPALTQSENDQLYKAVQQKYRETRDKRLQYLRIKEDPYFNALQVKFSYAITCHKAQGGQWKHVFVDQGYVTPDHLGTEYMRWIYTAITRATERLYLVNFKEEFISE